MLLNCHTYYSFCYGTLSTEELITEVCKNGYDSFVLSDINNTSACIDTVRLCKEKKISPALGIDFRNGVTACYTGIARNNKGFRELNEHLTFHLHSKKPFLKQAPAMENVYVVYPFSAYTGKPLEDNEFIGIPPSALTRLPFSPLRKMQDKLVVWQPVSFGNKKQFNAHRLLRAIDKNTLLSKLQATEQAHPGEIMPMRSALYEMYRHYPGIIAATEKLLGNCSISFVYGKFADKNLAHYTSSFAEDMELLREKSLSGMEYRFGKNPSGEVMARWEKELEIIAQMKFASYFLINWDIVNYARSKNYFYVGRGSGANSLIAYLLRITDVDPVELDLYFERFINPFRTNPPDFDIDFSWTDRDDITKYIFNRFGKQRTALLGSYNTFQHDAVIRQLGKVFGLPPAEIDKLQKTTYAGADSMGKLVLGYSQLIHGFPSHLSIHSSGILISEEPITSYSPTFMPPKGFPATQFSMLEAEDIGLYKFDILSQRGLGKIKDAVSIIKQNKNTEIDIHDVQLFKKDEKVKNLLRQGKAIGCFYIESPAMRMLLTKLRADDYLRLVAASSIIRPGVSKSGMMREYILRYRHPELREKARKELPELYDLLKETYGVMVYQEDVIKVAHFFAGLTLAEADYLRRGMSWKFKQRNEFSRVQENFFSNCRKKGYGEKTISDIWMQIESFANYAFSKGHSASYAVESFQALYLKAYFPLEYMVATLNNGGGFYRTEIYVHEARMNGAEIKPPCINNSTALCEINGSTIYLGISMISEIEAETIKKILSERSRGGNFSGLADFTQRVSVSVEQLRLLVRAGVFDSFTAEETGAEQIRSRLLWQAHALVNPSRHNTYTASLFNIKPSKLKIPQLERPVLENAFDEKELLGFSLCSPFKLLRDALPSRLTAFELPLLTGKKAEIAGYMVAVKRTATSKGESMYFGTFIDTNGHWIDTVHFPPSAKQYRFTGPGCYLLCGKVVNEHGHIMLEIDKMLRLAVTDREKD